MRKSCLIVAGLVILCALVFALPANAVIYVKWNASGPAHNGTSWCNAYLTIQEALNVAATGEVVFVAGAPSPGAVYAERVVFKSGAILRGGYRGDCSISPYDTRRDPVAWVTVIDGGAADANSRTVTSFADGTVDGFTIRGSDRAVYCDTSFTVSGNIIRGTNVGVYCKDASPTITGNTLDGGGTGGNGIICWATIWCQGYATCSPQITNNSLSGWIGSQIYCEGSYFVCEITLFNRWYGQSICAPMISGNIIQGGGSGVGCKDSSPTVQSNSITGRWGIVCEATATCFGYNGPHHGVCEPTIAGNLIQDCSERGINCRATRATGCWLVDSAEGDCRPLVSNNTIKRCPNAMYVDRATPTVLGNTIEGARDSGSAIYCCNTVSASPMTSLTINGNSITGHARGVRCAGVSVTVTNNRIWANREEGVLCESGSASEVTDNTISGGTVGIECAASSPQVARNIITRCATGGILCQNSVSSVEDNLITYGRAYGVACQGGSPIFRNNTIVHTTAGLQFESGTPSAYNNIISGNLTGVLLFTGSATLGYNDLWANEVHYDGLTKPATDISVDPQFLAPFAGEYHLRPGSPCIGAGDNAQAALPKDLDGKDRILPVGGTVDIGCFEWDDTPYWVRDPGQAKEIPSQYTIRMKPEVVTAAWTDSFYIEGDDRSSGILVQKAAHGLTGDNQRADVTGTVATNAEGEVYLQATAATAAGTGTVAPLGIICRSVGGSPDADPESGLGQQGIPGVKGMNNIGLLIRVFGRIIEIETVIAPDPPTWFMIDDGVRQIKCVASEGNPAIDPAWLNKRAVVTGISSCEFDGPNLASRIKLKKGEIPIIY